MLDRDLFWAKARSIFNGPSQGQVDGTNAILDGFEKRYPDGDPRWLAYYLATAKWETVGTMLPVKEAFWLSEDWRRENLRYYPYYGRGLVQLTWLQNYQRESQPDRTGVDIASNPDRALEPPIAADIMFVGMEHGDFGGGGMSKWFNDDTEDPVGARHLVNGTDHAEAIAALYRNFLYAIQAAQVTA
jgi:hypothetical protein